MLLLYHHYLFQAAVLGLGMMIQAPPGFARCLPAGFHDWWGRDPMSSAGLEDKEHPSGDDGERTAAVSGQGSGAYLLFMSFFNTTILL